MHLETSTVLINNITVKDFMKWGRDEVGGDLAQEILQNGFAEQKNFLADVTDLPSQVLYGPAVDVDAVDEKHAGVYRIKSWQKTQERGFS